MKSSWDFRFSFLLVRLDQWDHFVFVGLSDFGFSTSLAVAGVKPASERDICIKFLD